MTTARYGVLNLSLGDERYEQVLGQILDGVHLRSRMWADAEHRFEEIPGKVWTVVLARQNDRRIPAAWAAGTVQHVGGEPVLLCSDNYERRGPGRRWGLYKEAYRHRHATLVTTSTFPTLTHLFAEPIPPA